MSYQTDRDYFVAEMTRHGLPMTVTLALLREATGLHRRAELACSSEWADRDRVTCPAARDPKHGKCLCDHYQGDGQPHEQVTRISVQDWWSERRIEKALPAGWVMQTQGDPRGYTLRVIPPSYAERNAGRDYFNRDSIGVPSRPSRLRF